MNSIRYEQLNNEYTLIDIRNRSSFLYGHLKDAINYPYDEHEDLSKVIKSGEKYCIYDDDGVLASKVCEQLIQNGQDVKFLSGGFKTYLKESYISSLGENKNFEVEESIRKKFHNTLLSKFTKAICEYNLLKEGDKVAVCISGGKDSFVLAKLFQELKRHNKFPFEVEFLVMDPGYSKENRRMIEENARVLNIPLHIFESNIFESVQKIDKSPCYICARMRRGNLYAFARELGCNKIALGHHYDDVIETILMGMLYGAQIQTMMPRLNSTNFEGMQLIRPMYLIREKDIIRFRDYNGLQFIQCACKFTELTKEELDKKSGISSKRKKVKLLIESLKNEDPQIEGNIFKSVENVNLSTVIAYKDFDGVKKSILDQQ